MRLSRKGKSFKFESCHPTVDELMERIGGESADYDNIYFIIDSDKIVDKIQDELKQFTAVTKEDELGMIDICTHSPKLLSKYGLQLIEKCVDFLLFHKFGMEFPNKDRPNPKSISQRQIYNIMEFYI